MRERGKKDGDQGPGQEGKGRRNEEEWDTLEDENAGQALESEKRGPQGGFERRNDDEDLEKEGLYYEDEEGAGKYSDVDAMFEQKLKNNEYVENYVDVFDELLGETAKGK